MGKNIFLNYVTLLKVAYTDKSHSEITTQPEKETYGLLGPGW